MTRTHRNVQSVDRECLLWRRCHIDGFMLTINAHAIFQSDHCVVMRSLPCVECVRFVPNAIGAP